MEEKDTPKEGYADLMFKRISMFLILGMLAWVGTSINSMEHTITEIKVMMARTQEQIASLTKKDSELVKKQEAFEKKAEKRFSAVEGTVHKIQIDVERLKTLKR